MLDRLTIKAYGEDKKGNCTYDFLDEEKEMIYDLFCRLSEKCMESFSEIKQSKVSRKGDMILIEYDFGEAEEKDCLFYLESLTGHRSENIIFFDDQEYLIKGKPVIDYNDEFLEKMENISKSLNGE
jgi:hypothetical protein